MNRQLITTAAFAALMTAMTPHAGHAQAAASDADSRGTLEEVVVTARRVNENLQDVPVAVTALTGEALRAQRVQGVYDLQRATPSLGVSFPSGGRGAATPIYMLRGQRGFNPVALSEPTVTVYFDEVGQSLPTGTNLGFYDLSSVQVLKGPQGTLFGRNNTGGAVLITSNRPTQQFEGYAQASLGNHDYNDLEGVINAPVSDTLAIRLAGKLTRRDGYVHDLLQNRNVNNQHSESARLSILWKPTDDLTSNTVVTYFQDDEANATKLQTIDPLRPPALGALTPIFLQRLTAAFNRANSIGRYEVENNVSQKSRNFAKSIQNVTQYDLGEKAYLKNIIGYRLVETNWSNDTDGSGFDTLNSTGYIKAKQFSNELQLGGSFGAAEYILGLYYQQLHAVDFSDSPTFTGLRDLAPAAFPTWTGTNLEAHNRSYAAFVHLNYDLEALVSGLSVSAGARITRDHRGVDFQARTGAGVDPYAPIYRCTLTGNLVNMFDSTGCSVPASVNFTRPTWDVSLNYKIDPDMLIYVAHRHGYRSGGFNTSPASLAEIPGIVFKPETVDDIEVGSKSDFNIGDLRGRLNVAAYYSWYDDAQRTVSTAIPNSPRFTPITVNAAKAHVKGLEAELLLKPSDRLTLQFGGSLTDAAYDRWQDTYVVSGVRTVIDISDSKFIQVPKTQFSVRGSYVLPLSEDMGELTAHVGYSYQSSVQTAEINTANCGPDGLYANCRTSRGRLPGYGLLDARLDWTRIGGRNVNVSVFATNLTNKYYNNDAAGALGIFGYQAASIGAPRMVGVELRVPFGAMAD